MKRRGLFSNYMHAGPDAVSIIDHPPEGVKVGIDKEGIMFEPENGSDACILMYPGAKVDEAAYAQLASALAQNGTACLILKVPFHMPLFDEAKAEKYVKGDNRYKYHYIAGHSLGGVQAAKAAAKCPQLFDGIILIAARSTVADISGIKLPVLSILAGNDGVCTRERFDRLRDKLPEEIASIIIQGGNHAGFADYGNQKWDNKATITRDMQIKETVEAILKFMETERQRS